MKRNVDGHVLLGVDGRKFNLEDQPAGIKRGPVDALSLHLLGACGFSDEGGDSWVAVKKTLGIVPSNRRGPLHRAFLLIRKFAATSAIKKAALQSLIKAQAGIA